MGKKKEARRLEKERRKEEKRLEKERRKEEKAKKREEKLRLAEQKAAQRASEEESALEKREKALLRRARRTATVAAAAPAPATASPGSDRGGRRRRGDETPDAPAVAVARKSERRAPKAEVRAASAEAEVQAPSAEPEVRAASAGSEPRVASAELESLSAPSAPSAVKKSRAFSAVKKGPASTVVKKSAAPSAVKKPPAVKKKPTARRRPPVMVQHEPINEPELEDEINAQEEVEAQLDRLLRRSMTPAAAERAREVLGDGERLAGRLSAEGPEPRSASVLDSARELLSSDYYLRVWGQLGMRGRSVEVDEYGLDPKVEQKWQPFFDFLYRTYWRVQVRGIENVPDEGRCLLVANHSGTIPYDGAMIKTAVLREHPARRSVRWLAEDFVFHFPFLGAFMNRIGAVRACQENADRMLRQERLVAVFPEGIKGIGKLYKERYRLQRFGRGGYVKLVLRTGAPIVPVAVVGAEEIHPMLLRGRPLANMIGMPYLPVTPTFPWLGPLGLVPLPSRWMIQFGEPILFEGYGPESAEDPVLVSRLNDEVRLRIQQMVDALLAIRTGAA